MKYPRTAQVDKAVATDKYRHNLTHCFIDCQGVQPYMIATDGKIMAQIPVEADKAEEGYVSVQAVKAARKAARKADQAEIACNGSLAIPTGETFPRPSMEETGKFPAWRLIIPAEHREGAIRIGLDATLLKNLSDAIGADTIIMDLVPNQPNMPIRVTVLKAVDSNEACKDNVGVIMQVKIAS